MDLMALFEQGRKDCTKLHGKEFEIYLELLENLFYDEIKVLVKEGLEAFKKLGLKPVSRVVYCDYDHPGDRAYAFSKYSWER